jgi:hypothetical protein
MAKHLVYKQVKKLADEYGEGLSSKDKRFNGVVQIIGCDGTSLLFSDAFCIAFVDEDDMPEWVTVHTEHNGTHVFCYDELVICKQFKQIPAAHITRSRLIPPGEREDDDKG